MPAPVLVRQGQHEYACTSVSRWGSAWCTHQHCRTEEGQHQCVLKVLVQAG